MNVYEAVERACEEPSLVQALSWIADWECDRAIKQARKYFETGESTAGHGGGWDTCFEFCFKGVMEAYGNNTIFPNFGFGARY